VSLEQTYCLRLYKIIFIYPRFSTTLKWY